MAVVVGLWCINMVEVVMVLVLVWWRWVCDSSSACWVKGCM